MSELNELKQQLFKDAEFKQAYDELEEEFQLIDTLVSMRTQAGLTQTDIAEKMGTQPSNISRLESGKVSPKLETLRNYAHACGFKLKLQFSN